MGGTLRLQGEFQRIETYLEDQIINIEPTISPAVEIL